MSQTTEQSHDYTTAQLTEIFQNDVNTYYDNHKYISDEAIDSIIDSHWEDIPIDEDTIELTHPGISNALIIIEFNPDYDEDYDEDENNWAYQIHRIYSDDSDSDRDDTEIENGEIRDQLRIINTLVPTINERNMNRCI